MYSHSSPHPNSLPHMYPARPPYSPDPQYSPTNSLNPTYAIAPEKPNRFTAHFHSLKRTVENGHATSFAKAAYAGGTKAQSSFLKNKAMTQGVKTGNVPIVAWNAARAVYKGGKVAGKAWKEAEKERMERLARKGKVDRERRFI